MLEFLCGIHGSASQWTIFVELSQGVTTLASLFLVNILRIFHKIEDDDKNAWYQLERGVHGPLAGFLLQYEKPYFFFRFFNEINKKTRLPATQ